MTVAVSKPASYLFVSIINGGTIITHTQSKNLFGLLLIILGLLLVLNNFDVEVFRYSWPALIIAVGLYLIFRDARKRRGLDSEHSEFKILGDSYHPDFSGEIDGADISHFIGDISLNLSAAQLKSGVNTLSISAFIGDIEVIVPESMAVRAQCSAFIGDILILDRKHGTMFTSTTQKSPNYESAEKKLHINGSAFIGDIKIRNLGTAAVK